MIKYWIFSFDLLDIKKIEICKILEKQSLVMIEK